MSLLCIGVLTFNISGFHIATCPANGLSYKNWGCFSDMQVSHLSHAPVLFVSTYKLSSCLKCFWEEIRFSDCLGDHNHELHQSNEEKKKLSSKIRENSLATQVSEGFLNVLSCYTNLIFIRLWGLFFSPWCSHYIFLPLWNKAFASCSALLWQHSSWAEQYVAPMAGLQLDSLDQ